MLIDGAIASKTDVAHYASTTNRNVCLKRNEKYGKISKTVLVCPTRRTKERN